MKRKFITEYALGYLNSYTCAVPAHQMLRGGKTNPDDEQEIAKCHIYIIAARPIPYFKNDKINFTNNQLSGEICYRIDGQESCIPFEGYPWTLDHKDSLIQCRYPFREIRSYNPDGTEGTYVPATALTLQYQKGAAQGANDLNRYEVLYVGQSIGQGNRSALERLKNHGTLQKILALTNHDYPDKEIMIFMHQFDHEQLFSSMDGRARDADASEKNETRLVNAIANPPNNKQKIGLIEAALIRYFQPHYNEIFKIKFPSTKHKVLKSCRDLDVSSLVVEVNCDELNYLMYTSTVRESMHHIAKIDLVAAENRISFFNATGLVEIPGIIK